MSSVFVRPDVRMFLDYLNNLPGPRSHEVGPAEARIMLQRSRQVADTAAGELAIIRDLSCEGPRGPIPRATTTVPSPTVPPSAQPIARTVISMAVRARRIDQP